MLSVFAKPFVVSVAVFVAVLLIGVFLIREHSGRGGMAVFAMFVVLACIAALMAASLVAFPSSES